MQRHQLIKWANKNHQCIELDPTIDQHGHFIVSFMDFPYAPFYVPLQLVAIIAEQPIDLQNVFNISKMEPQVGCQEDLKEVPSRMETPLRCLPLPSFE